MQIWKKINRGLLELVSGILFLGVACLVMGLFLVKEPLEYAAALMLGVMLALIIAYQIYRTLNRSLEYDGKDAAKIVTATNIVRYLCIIIIFYLVWMTDNLNPLFTFLGLMTLKFGAYLQPIMHRIYDRIFYEVE